MVFLIFMEMSCETLMYVFHDVYFLWKTMEVGTLCYFEY